MLCRWVNVLSFLYHVYHFAHAVLKRTLILLPRQLYLRRRTTTQLCERSQVTIRQPSLINRTDRHASYNNACIHSLTVYTFSDCIVAICILRFVLHVACVYRVRDLSMRSPANASHGGSVRCFLMRHATMYFSRDVMVLVVRGPMQL
jgi:hypothetical protein